MGIAGTPLGRVSSAAHDCDERGAPSYPYLLRNLATTHPNQPWSTDIAYIPMQRGFMHLVAVIDWDSRYGLVWRLSDSLEARFCLEALEQALSFGHPEIFNADQGVQFSARAFTGRLEGAGIRVSVDGRGLALDNIFIERFWRLLKYEDIYLRDYATVPDLEAGLQRYLAFYNDERPHQSLHYAVPNEVHHGTVALVC